jgi:sporulation protein YlmC with PRC-barrel domain
MLQLSGTILNKPVLSLRSGGPIATIIAPIVNPDNLKIEGFYCDDRFNKEQLILLCQDIREVMLEGLAVNDQDVLTEPSELIRLKKILDIDYSVVGKQVETASHQRIGKVSDYAIETNSMYVQKLYVSRSILKSLNTGSISIDRSQVIETTNRRIIIQDLLQLRRSATAPSIA